MAQATKAGLTSVPARFTRYISDVRSEMRRVVWPSRNEVVNSSIIVLVTLAFFIVFTLFVDQVSTVIIDVLNRIGG